MPGAMCHHNIRVRDRLGLVKFSIRIRIRVSVRICVRVAEAWIRCEELGP